MCTTHYLHSNQSSPVEALVLKILFNAMDICIPEKAHCYRAIVWTCLKQGVLLLDKLLDTNGSIRKVGINLGLDIPGNLVPWICASDKIKNFF